MTLAVGHDDSSDSEDLDLSLQTPRETSMEIPEGERFTGNSYEQRACSMLKTQMSAS